MRRSVRRLFEGRGGGAGGRAARLLRVLALSPSACRRSTRTSRASARRSGPARGHRPRHQAEEPPRGAGGADAPAAQAEVAVLKWLDLPSWAPATGCPELLEAAGASTRSACRPGGPGPWLKPGELAAFDPDVLIAAPCGFPIARTRPELSELLTRPDWSALRAVREGRVFVGDGNEFFSRPGPRLVGARRDARRDAAPGRGPVRPARTAACGGLSPSAAICTHHMIEYMMIRELCFTCLKVSARYSASRRSAAACARCRRVRACSSRAPAARRARPSAAPRPSAPRAASPRRAADAAARASVRGKRPLLARPALGGQRLVHGAHRQRLQRLEALAHAGPDHLRRALSREKPRWSTTA